MVARIEWKEFTEPEAKSWRQYNGIIQSSWMTMAKREWVEVLVWGHVKCVAGKGIREEEKKVVWSGKEEQGDFPGTNSKRAWGKIKYLPLRGSAGEAEY